MTCRIRCLLLFTALCQAACGGEPIDIWPELAPGETTRSLGEQLPPRPDEKPTVTRVINITRPTMTVHLADQPNGTAVLILPGGGFGKVVPDKEGTEAADWLNQQGISAFVLSYRTSSGENPTPPWHKPLQDAQRSLSLLRSQADRWGFMADRLGLVAFSAGGQVGARLLCDGGALAYDPIDGVDRISHRPNFAILIYPWNIYDVTTSGLVEGIKVSQECPPSFLVHTHDDRSSSVGTALFYIELKRFNIPAELHVYGNGGHGYGLRSVAGSQVSGWPEHAAHWLQTLEQTVFQQLP